MTSERKQLKALAAVAVIVMGMIFLVSVATAEAATVQRPLQDFLSTQGTFCVPDGQGGCFLFVPPDPNFLGWMSAVNVQPVRFAGVDYAGLATEAYASGRFPQFTGTVTERPLQDGTAEVTVRLHTKNANVWVIELDLNGDLLDQVANKPTVFGHRPIDVSHGAAQALGDSFLHVVFINSAPGAPLPDLIEINGTPAIKFAAFTMKALGPLTAQFGVPEGTPGQCTIVQTAPFMANGQGLGIADGFPVEKIELKVVGR